MNNTALEHPKLRQIRAWKVLLFSILSLGIYSLVWLVKRKGELESPQDKTPHWLWLASMLSTLIIASVAVVIGSLTFEDARVGAEFSVYASLAVGLAATVGFAWWTASYVIVINRAIGVPASPFALVTLSFFFAPVAVTLTQYAINRDVDVRVKLGGIYKQAAIVAAIAGLIFTVSSYMSPPISERISNTERDIKSLHQDLDRAINTSSKE